MEIYIFVLATKVVILQAHPVTSHLNNSVVQSTPALLLCMCRPFVDKDKHLFSSMVCCSPVRIQLTSLINIDLFIHT